MVMPRVGVVAVRAVVVGRRAVLVVEEHEADARAADREEREERPRRCAALNFDAPSTTCAAASVQATYV